MKLAKLRASYPLDGTHRPILMTEVTRMTGGLVCVAGIDIHAGTMARPLYPNGNNWPEAEWCPTDIMVVGNIISVERHPRVPTLYPHATEDMSVVRAFKSGDISKKSLHDVCRELHDASISSIFSQTVIDGKYISDGTNCRSLGCIEITPDRIHPHVFYDKLRINIHDIDGRYYDPPVTELETKNTGDANAGLAALQARLAAHDHDYPIILRIGLTRGWVGPDHNWDPKRCTIQINGIVERN
ncbi:hypothetical protein [Sphingomonas sp. S-NIH.Pt15_0812]|uniref:hypothetical protein n=1 Tax=Sphingomonas sp. S-NIH.Pt15_0812 TaxID=1920129 RepID=UPI000F7D6CF8|nr:hypothetical protein [Sphingomonas sp. S-NIH.Pt15_0812]